MTNPQEPVRICAICQRRPYMRTRVCNPCRERLPLLVGEVADLYQQLESLDSGLDSEWTVQQLIKRPVPTTNPFRLPGWEPGPWTEQPGHDPIAAVLPMNAKPSSGGPRVTGSREAPVPVDIDAIDLTMPARNAAATSEAKRWPDDQVGRVAVATILDQWTRDWRDEMAFAQSLPVPTVPVLAKWLSDRCQWACDRHNFVGEFAGEMRRLRAILRGALGLIEPELAICDGVVCRDCDHYSLFRDAGYVECGSCGLLYTEAEYQDWVRLLASYARKEAA